MAAQISGAGEQRRGWDPLWLAKKLADPSRPVFLLGSTPPREGTTEDAAIDICNKFVARSRTQATDGFIVYDIQDEASRNEETRPFPFRKTIDPSAYAALFPTASGKSTVVYKAVVEPDEAAFSAWIDHALHVHGHRTVNLVGASSAADLGSRIRMDTAARLLNERGVAFGCVTIAERHTKKGNEHLNIIRKTQMGAQWFISQAVYDAEATVKLLQDYAAECHKRGLTPAKVILTFAPCGRPKTMAFLRWLGIQVPPDVETRVLNKAQESKEAAVMESIVVLTEALQLILRQAGHLGVPLGVSVESVSGFREEIDGCFELFRRLQTLLLDSRGTPWGVHWYKVPLGSLARTASEEHLLRLEANMRSATQADPDGETHPKPEGTQPTRSEGTQPTPEQVHAIAGNSQSRSCSGEVKLATHAYPLLPFAAGLVLGVAVGLRLQRAV